MLSAFFSCRQQLLASIHLLVCIGWQAGALLFYLSVFIRRPVVETNMYIKCVICRCIINSSIVCSNLNFKYQLIYVLYFSTSYSKFSGFIVPSLQQYHKQFVVNEAFTAFSCSALTRNFLLLRKFFLFQQLTIKGILKTASKFPQNVGAEKWCLS